MSELMKRAWEIYKTLEGDHRAKLSLAMKIARKELKTPDAETIKRKLQAQGLKVTRKKGEGKDILYVNGYHPFQEYYIDAIRMVARGNMPAVYDDMEEHFKKAKITSIFQTCAR